MKDFLVITSTLAFFAFLALLVPSSSPTRPQEFEQAKQVCPSGLKWVRSAASLRSRTVTATCIDGTKVEFAGS